MKSDWIRTVDPVIDLVTLTEAKLQCRALMDVSDEDPLFSIYRRGVTNLIEEVTNRGLLTQTWVYTVDDFADEFWLPRAAPLQSVTSVKYYDMAGVQQTLSTSFYRVDTASEPGRVVRKPLQVFPLVQADRGQTVEITYVCGWSSAAQVPDALKTAALLLLNHLWENRGAVQVGVGIGAVELPLGVQSFLAPYMVSWRPPVWC